MKSVQYSVRLPRALDVALRRAAAARQTSAYALLQQTVRAGLAQLSGDLGQAEALAQLNEEIGGHTARLVRIERLTERALYVATAAYVYARAGVGARADDARLSQDITAAFSRQLQQAGD